MNIIPYTADKIPAVVEYEQHLREEEPFFTWDIGETYQNALRAELRARGVDTLIALIAANDEAQRFYRSLEGAEIRDEGLWLTP